MKPTIPILFLAATLCASTLVMPQARADYFDMGQDYINTGMSMAALEPTMRQLARDAEHQMDENTGRKSSHSVRRTPKKALTTTTYRESSAVHNRVLTRFTDWVATHTNATDAAAIRRDFENDMLGRWAKESSENGLHRGDVADALTS